MKENPLTVEEVLAMNLPPIIIYCAPFFFIFVALEWYIGVRKQQKLYDSKDFAAATTIGLVNVLISALTKAATFAVVLFIYNMVPWSIPPAWWSFIGCFFVLDLCRYWAHKVGHEHRFWWATHVTHHSSKQYNFSVGFRLSWIQQIKIIFFLPVVLMGFHPLVFFICHQVAVVYQFWIHTELIRKMPAWFEFFFVTPSHHRVHHATNPQYIDKNYGSTFIIWDRIFGTFEPEVEKPNYGITKPVNSYNPIYLVFHEVIDICKDLRHAKSPKQFFQVLSKGPGEEVVTAPVVAKEIKMPVSSNVEGQTGKETPAPPKKVSV